MQVEPYQRKQANFGHSKFAVGVSAVVNLVNKLPRNFSFKIYANKFFPSLDLFDKLHLLRSGFTEFVQENCLKTCQIRGGYNFQTNITGNCTVTLWLNNRDIL